MSIRIQSWPERKTSGIDRRHGKFKFGRDFEDDDDENLVLIKMILVSSYFLFNFFFGVFDVSYDDISVGLALHIVIFKKREKNKTGREQY